MSYHSETKQSVGLGNVDNTSDANKPVSTAQAASIATKLTIPSGTTSQYVDGTGALQTLAASAYKSYQAVVTQTGTSAPSASVYMNQLGTTLTWARTSAGLYTLTAGSAVFTSNKTVIFLSNPITGLVSYLVVPTSTSVITVSTLLLSVIATVLTAVNTDALMTNLGIEVRVYN
jgi:hypothetical protein